MTHNQFSLRAKLSQPCTASNITFGGRCLNCGYNPENYNPATRKIAEFKEKFKQKQDKKQNEINKILSKPRK